MYLSTSFSLDIYFYANLIRLNYESLDQGINTYPASLDQDINSIFFLAQRQTLRVGVTYLSGVFFGEQAASPRPPICWQALPFSGGLGFDYRHVTVISSSSSTSYRFLSYLVRLHHSTSC
jgi:hypothetical protein